MPLDLSEKYRNFFLENIPDFLEVNGGGKLFTLKGTQICKEYGRIVVGDYGAFIEFSEPSNEFIIAPGQEYRVYDKKYKDNVKYIWLTVKDGSNIKIYHQRKRVPYADYIPNKYYVSVHEVKVGA